MRIIVYSHLHQLGILLRLRLVLPHDLPGDFFKFAVTESRHLDEKLNLFLQSDEFLKVFRQQNAVLVAVVVLYAKIVGYKLIFFTVVDDWDI